MLSVLPSAYMSCQPRYDGNISLKHWALGWYPAVTMLTWLQDGKKKTQDIELIETRPTGDWTSQKWQLWWSIHDYGRNTHIICSMRGCLSPSSWDGIRKAMRIKAPSQNQHSTDVLGTCSKASVLSKKLRVPSIFFSERLSQLILITVGIIVGLMLLAALIFEVMTCKKISGMERFFSLTGRVFPSSGWFATYQTEMVISDRQQILGWSLTDR